MWLLNAVDVRILHLEANSYVKRQCVTQKKEHRQLRIKDDGTAHRIFKTATSDSHGCTANGGVSSSNV